jgi:hypothetical protein
MSITNRMIRPIIFALTLYAGWGLPWAGPVDREVSFCPAARAEESWLTEMEDICARSNDAMTFSEAELQRLIARCDKLKTRIETLDESARKVYGRRLLMCRQLYTYVLESKKEKERK